MSVLKFVTFSRMSGSKKGKSEQPGPRKPRFPELPPKYRFTSHLTICSQYDFGPRHMKQIFGGKKLNLNHSVHLVSFGTRQRRCVAIDWTNSLRRSDRLYRLYATSKKATISHKVFSFWLKPRAQHFKFAGPKSLTQQDQTSSDWRPTFYEFKDVSFVFVSENIFVVFKRFESDGYCVLWPI